MNYIDEIINYSGIEKFIERDKLKNIKVAFIDTGCSVDNEELKKYDIRSYKVDSTQDSEDAIGHGTFFAQILCKYTSIKNVHPKIISIKCGDNIQISVNDICKAIERAIDLDVDVINIGLCNTSYSYQMAKIIDTAIKKGIIITAPGGNNIKNEYTYPASLHNVISCGSCDENKKLANHSNINKFIDVLAPGCNIKGFLLPQQKLYNSNNCLSGTSFATAFLTALAVLAKSCNLNMNTEKFRSIIRKNRVINFYRTLHEVYIEKNNCYEINKEDESPIYIQVCTKNRVNLGNGSWKIKTYLGNGEEVKFNGDLEISLINLSNNKSSSIFYSSKVIKGECEFDINHDKPGIYVLDLKIKEKLCIPERIRGIIYPSNPKYYIKLISNSYKIKFETDSDNEVFYSLNSKINLTNMQEHVKKYEKNSWIDTSESDGNIFVVSSKLGLFSEQIIINLKNQVRRLNSE